MGYTLTHTAEEVDKALSVALSSGVLKRIEITLSVANWVMSSDGLYYTHNLTIENSTANTKVDLDPTLDQFVSIMNEELTMFVANEEGSIKAVCIGGVPSSDLTMTALISEVTYE